MVVATISGAKSWKIRKGYFPTAGASRATQTSIRIPREPQAQLCALQPVGGSQEVLTFSISILFLAVVPE